MSSQVGTINTTGAVITVNSSPLPFGSYPGGLISGSSFTGNGDNTSATNQPGDPPIDGNPASHRLYLRWTAPSGTNGNGIMEFTTLGSAVDTVMAIYAGTNLATMVQQTADDDNGGYLTSRAFIRSIGGTNYLIAVDGFSGAAGPIVLSGNLNTNLNSLAQPDSQPQDQGVLAGGTATFSVSDSNTANVTYQWAIGDWLKIPGATNSTLIISNVGPGDVDVYTAIVTSGTNGPSVDSTRATLEIGPSLSFPSWGYCNGNSTSRRAGRCRCRRAEIVAGSRPREAPAASPRFPSAASVRSSSIISTPIRRKVSQPTSSARAGPSDGIWLPPCRRPP